MTRRSTPSSTGVARRASRTAGCSLTEDVKEIYRALHRAGLAYSAEVYLEGELAGGVFGVLMGGLATAESIFHARPNGGNAAIVAAVELARAEGATLFDLQHLTPHMERYGGIELPRDAYLKRLQDALCHNPSRS